MSRLTGVMAVLCLTGLLAPSAGAGFTGTPAAVKLVRELRAAYKTIGATGYVLTGDVVYCPSVAEGWTFAPQPGCRTPARVSEVDDLVNGRVIRAVGHVTAPSRPMLRYVVSSLGWFQAPVGAPCWRSFGLPFVAAQFVSYPFPGQRLSIIRRTRSEIARGPTSSTEKSCSLTPHTRPTGSSTGSIGPLQARRRRPRRAAAEPRSPARADGEWNRRGRGVQKL
jgi:hypothetical protein